MVSLEYFNHLKEVQDMELDIIVTSLLFGVVFFSMVGSIILQIVRWLRDCSSSAYMRRIMSDYYKELKVMK